MLDAERLKNIEDTQRTILHAIERIEQKQDELKMLETNDDAAMKNISVRLDHLSEHVGQLAGEIRKDGIDG